MVYYRKNWRTRRSVLFMPASNRRVLIKVHDLDCDGVIFDLEDSVSEEDQGEARENLLELVRGRDFGRKETIIRVSASGCSDYVSDIDVAVACEPNAILVPKVETADVLYDLSKRLDDLSVDDLDIWAMIETPRGIVNLKEIASVGGRLNCLVLGPNDLARETGVAMAQGRVAMLPWLMDVVVQGRSNALVLLDGVYNAFGDVDGLREECLQGVSMGFDGKTLIHPRQIDVANQIFSPGKEQIRRAEQIVDLFQKPENLHKNALQLDGEMVERLHFDNAKTLLEQVDRFV
jgi:citrate lyase subunit beta/citryl-CoA lyase